MRAPSSSGSSAMVAAAMPGPGGGRRSGWVSGWPTTLITRYPLALLPTVKALGGAAASRLEHT